MFGSFIQWLLARGASFWTFATAVVAVGGYVAVHWPKYRQRRLEAPKRRRRRLRHHRQQPRAALDEQISKLLIAVRALSEGRGSAEPANDQKHLPAIEQVAGTKGR